MKKIMLSLVVVAFFAVGCTTTQKSTAGGGILGAAIGGIVGHQSGHGGEGAAIGAAAGALGGYVVGDKMLAQKKFCPVCGVQYEGNVRFCPKDGAELKMVEK
ncbi:MAG: glycine zipper 2TM domain-containing protein [Candidatus Omnitrophica bacterium]|nr:glycine zipper 2TM domain-containing protein [Candidatus Omnitrophota bacterium]